MSASRRVVLVDDEEDLRDPVVEYLAAEGLEAEGVAGGEDDAVEGVARGERDHVLGEALELAGPGQRVHAELEVDEGALAGHAREARPSR